MEFLYLKLLLVTKFGCRYFPDDTSSYARRSLTLRDSKSIRLSSNETSECRGKNAYISIRFIVCILCLSIYD